MTKIKDSIRSCDNCGIHVDFDVYVNVWCSKCDKDFCSTPCFATHKIESYCKGYFICILDPQYKMQLAHVAGEEDKARYGSAPMENEND